MFYVYMLFNENLNFKISNIYLDMLIFGYLKHFRIIKVLEDYVM